MSLSNACGPAVVAAIACIDREYATEILIDINPSYGRSNRKYTSLYDLKKALDALGFNCTITQLPANNRVTVAEFNDSHPVGKYVICTSNHFISTWDGMFLENNGVAQLGSKVEWVMSVSTGEKS